MGIFIERHIAERKDGIPRRKIYRYIRNNFTRKRFKVTKIEKRDDGFWGVNYRIPREGNFAIVISPADL